MAETTRSTDRKNGSVGNEIGQVRTLVREAGRDAQDALNRSTKASVNTFDTYANVAQQMTEENLGLWSNSLRQSLQLWTDMVGGAVGAIDQTLRSWVSQPTTWEGWQGMLDTSARAWSQFAEQAQATTEEGVERLKQAVDTAADQVKENGAELTKLTQDSARSRRAAAANS